MVESAIFFMIGFLSATLLALLAAPAISSRAARLANARARLLSPLSETQAKADRDALRAVHAVEIVKMEKKLSGAEWERGVARTQLARETARLLVLDATIRKLGAEAEEQERVATTLAADLRAAVAENAAKETAIWDLTGQRDAVQRRFVQSRAAATELESLIDRNRVEIATLATQVSALEVELSDARAGKGRFSGESVSSLQERLRASESAREDQTLELARMMRSAAERSAALAKAESARDLMEQQLAEIEQREKSILLNDATKTSLPADEAINASRAAPEEYGSRLELQREIDRLKLRLEETSASSEALTKGDAALRLAIAKLGRDLVRARIQDDEPSGAAQIVNFARREPTA